ncbi:hypothetical protein Mapa_002511 [Marchantia paleacea]|nr:hypothetical protein Mapa_002511 [Marchantia paleacea]
MTFVLTVHEAACVDSRDITCLDKSRTMLIKPLFAWKTCSSGSKASIIIASHCQTKRLNQ